MPADAFKKFSSAVNKDVGQAASHGYVAHTLKTHVQGNLLLYFEKITLLTNWTDEKESSSTEYICNA